MTYAFKMADGRGIVLEGYLVTSDQEQLNNLSDLFSGTDFSNASVGSSAHPSSFGSGATSMQG